MQQGVISVNRIKLTFGNVSILNDISFQINQGERVSLLGPGGCGKTTILKVILGLLAPDAGEVSLRGVDMVHATSDAKQNNLRKIGMAFQQGALFDYMTVKENLFFAMENMTEKTPAEMLKKVEELLAGVKLGKTTNMFPYELSGGMQRRVGIARALATEPEVAIFDEPTAGLDPVTSTIILNMIHDLVGKRASSTSLVSTSNVEIGIRYADRVIIVHQGNIVADGQWRDLLYSGSDWVRNFLSVRLIGLDYEYAKALDLPKKFLSTHWTV